MNAKQSVLLFIGMLMSACTSDGDDPVAATDVVVDVSLLQLRALDAQREGTLMAWFVSPNGDTVAAAPLTGTNMRLIAATAPVAMLITLQPPGTPQTHASRYHLLTGRFVNGRAQLTPVGALTASTLPLRAEPGQFTMFTPSDNATHPFPSNETSGVWLFNAEPRSTAQNDMWVRLTQLRDSWVYEGWVVRDFGSADPIWLSYGKFTPDQAGVVNRRDATGWGVFSGALDYRTAGAEDFPGDDWVSNPLNFAFPATLRLPINLAETRDGVPRWSHVITIEPAFDVAEALTTERPFPLILYRDEIRINEAGESQPITFRAESVPRGEAVLSR